MFVPLGIIACIVLDVLLAIVFYALFGVPGLVVLCVIFFIVGVVMFVLLHKEREPDFFTFILAPVMLVLPLIIGLLFGWLSWTAGLPQGIWNWKDEHGALIQMAIWLLWILMLVFFTVGSLFGLGACGFTLSDRLQSAKYALIPGCIMTIGSGIFAGGILSITSNYTF